jgi:hypothetical protein
VRRFLQYFQRRFRANDWPLYDVSNGDDGNGFLGQHAQGCWTLKPPQAQSETL